MMVIWEQDECEYRTPHSVKYISSNRFGIQGDSRQMRRRNRRRLNPWPFVGLVINAGLWVGIVYGMLYLWAWCHGVR